ncbi:MAG: N-acetylmuramoyl-L-alanine amidase [Dissulfurispiraceae bacterium]|jgi:N-acetylmuramoyl-L-alanine amidase|nr:N-acetylmuramoyl-L-alanine amidase [Dissulfurispiraceae bacterium]
MNADNYSSRSIQQAPTFLNAKTFMYLLLMSVFLLLAAGSLQADDQMEIKGLRHWAASEHIRVVLDLSGSVEFSANKLQNPERLFFDIRNAKLKKGLQTVFNINDNLLRTVRLGQFNATTVRIVFDISNPSYEYKVFILEDPARLVIDVFLKKHAEDKADEPSPESDLKKPQENKAAPPVQQLLKRKIVVDPGHGGDDPGAVGPTGLYEKDVVLDVALKLKQEAEKLYSHYEIILTRDRDIFIPLEKRTAIANKHNADLFVSIHVNASPNRKARGIETYLLNWTNDEEAIRVAARENRISIKKMKQVQGELDFITSSLRRENKRDESLKLAGYIQNSLVARVTTSHSSVHDLGVKQALFYVLVGAEMPSALAEISFISNPAEEKLLSSSRYRTMLAESILEGINSYFQSAPVQKIVRGKDTESDIKTPRPVSSSTDYKSLNKLRRIKNN